VDIADQMGTTALHYAAYLGYCNVISLLISKGATPLLRDCQVGITHKYPLMVKILSGKLTVTRVTILP